jgi:hypothetical protein
VGFRLLTKPWPFGQGFAFISVSFLVVADMLKDPSPQQHELEMVTLEELVPSNHLLRQIEAALDFSFIASAFVIFTARIMVGLRLIRCCSSRPCLSAICLAFVASAS